MNRRTYCEVLGRWNRQLPFVFESSHIGHVALLKVGVRVSGHSIRFWWWRWGFGAKGPG